MNKAYILGSTLLVESSLLIDPTVLTFLEQALVVVQQRLQAFASEAEFAQKMAIAFGEGVEVDSLRAAWLAGDFSIFPEIEIRNAAELNGANGAYGAATNRIYLSWEFLQANQGSIESLVGLLLEEIGHRVDGVLNLEDSAGDEGAILRALVQEESLSSEQLQQLKAEDDRTLITLDGQSIEIEKQDFIGTAGNDNITGTSGDDQLYGGAGNDTLDPGLGNDYADGDADGGAGTDTLKIDYSSITASGISHTNQNNGSGTISAGGHSVNYVNIEQFNITGTTQADNLIGGNLSDTLRGGAGNDILNGGAGNDTLEGGSGDDNYVVDRLDDTLTENADEGIDTIQSTVSYNLETLANVENVILTGGENLNATGNSLNNTLTGNNGNNTLSGNSGNDTLVGGAGNDSLDGGEGNDRLIGVNENNATPGLGEIDILQGGAGSDRFILDNTTKTFYDDGNTTSAGTSDYALIKDFNPNQDVIQLSGSKTNYTLDTTYSPGNTAIYRNKPNGEPAELIAIIEGITELDINSNTFTKPILVAGGLKAEYYDGYFNDNFSFFSQNLPVFTRHDATVNFSNSSTSWKLGNSSLADLDTFSVRWQGHINIPVTGNYTFYLNSDDASYLFLDNAVFSPTASNATVNNGGLHPSQERTGTAYLTAGLHDISIIFGENWYESNVFFFWSSTDAGITKQIVPSSSLLTFDEIIPQVDTLEFSQPNFIVNENGIPIVAVNVTRNGSLDSAVGATVTLTDGTAISSVDYNNAPINVNFAVGERTKTITIPIVNDAEFEFLETINLKLSNPTGNAIVGNQDTATLIISPNLTLNGSVKLTTGVNGVSPVFRLTDNIEQSGSTSLTNPISLDDDASFSTFFQFQISDSQGGSDVDGQGADGLVFVMHTDSNNIGSQGEGIGYSGINNSLGIEFDTRDNGSIDDDNGNHVGINLNGNIDSVVLQPIPMRFNNGNVWNAWVDYNGSTDVLEVRLSPTNQRPIDALLTYSVDLVSVLGQPNAFIGFTSGTGSAGGKHDIVDWKFNTSYNPIDSGILAFSNSEFSLNEDGTPVTAVTVSRTGGSDGEVSATISLSNGSAIAPDDYNNAPITVNFANGEISKTVTIPIVKDAIAESNETINLTLANPQGGATLGTQTTAVINIIDNENANGSPIQILTVDSRQNVFPIGQPKVYSQILTNGKKYRFEISGTWTPDYRYRINNWFVDAKFVTRDNFFSVNDLDPVYGYDFGLYSSVLGKNNDDFFGDYKAEHIYSLEYEGKGEAVDFYIFDINSGDNLGGYTIKIFEINTIDALPGVIQFSNASYSINEDGTPVTVVTVNRTGGSDGEVSANLTLSDGSATGGTDYNNTPIPVVFADGELSKTVVIPVFDDGLIEGNETVNLSLNNPTGGATIGTQKTAVLQIVDNDTSTGVSVVGGAGNDTLTTGNGRDSILGGAGDDILIGGGGADTLTGGDGNDRFVYTNIRDRGDTINDFEIGKDKIVFTQLLDSLIEDGYNGTNAIADGYVKIVQGTSANTFSVLLDADGSIGRDIFRPFITVNIAGFNSPSNFIF